MQSIIQLLHTLSLVMCTGAAGLGAAIGQQYAAQAALSGLERQPAVQAELRRSIIFALTLIETAAILALMVTIFIMYRPVETFAQVFAQVGMACAVGIPAATIGWLSAGPTQAALEALARQPFLSRQITNYMLFILSILQTPLIFGLICALILYAAQHPSLTLVQSLAYLGAGISIGLGSVGPIIGSCRFLTQTCTSIGRNKEALPRLYFFTLVSQVAIETPVIFATIIALLLIFTTTLSEHPLVGVTYLVVGLLMGIGTLGPGIGSGTAAAQAAREIGAHPEQTALFSRTSLIAQGLIDTIAVYVFIIALLTLFYPPF